MTEFMLLSSGLPGGSWQAVAVVTAPTPLPQVSSRCSGRPSVRPLVCLPGLCGVPPSPLLSLRSCVRDCACFHVTACAQRLEDSLGCQAPPHIASGSRVAGVLSLCVPG